MTATPSLGVAALRAQLNPRTFHRSALFCVTWLSVTLLVATLEAKTDPLTAWERLLGVLFGLLVPWVAFMATLALFRMLAHPLSLTALSARHGANRRHGFAVAVVINLVAAMVLTCAGLVLSRAVCHGAAEPIWNRDLLLCCGIGCLATSAYIAFLLASTRLGFGRAGAWGAFAVDLTLGHVNASWSVVLPHRHVSNLIGHPGVFVLSAQASSWVLLGLFLLGLTFAIARTPR